ncbi:MAG: phenylacetate--CoA ligase [Clostridiales bacterium]
MMYWEKTPETMSRDELHALQSVRLKKTVSKVYENVPFYRQKMIDKGVEVGDIKSIDDLSKLPFSYKTDLRDNYPYGLFAVPMSEIVRIHSSSGTTGKPTVVGYTKNDIEMWSNIVARSLVASGVTNKDIVQISYGYGLFTGGLGLHYGVEKLGAAVIPTSSGNTKKQIMIMKDYGTTVLACTPSYALYLADVMEDMGYTKDDFALRVGIFGAEPWTEEMRESIEKKWGIEAHDIYGLSEVMGPGVGIDCSEKKGLHIFDDHFYPEIIDSNTEKPLPYGTAGEVVFTTLTKEGLPLLRYRTHDITTLHDEKCKCGRTSVRMDKICGRSDDMLIIRGVNVFPSQIESVLLEQGNLSPHYHLVVDRVGTLDTLEVQVEISEAEFSGTVKNIEKYNRKIAKDIESILGLSAKVTLMNKGSLPRSEGKAQRVTDNRKLK